MMLPKATPENAIAFVKLSLVLSFAWPLSATASRWQIVCFKTFSCLTYVNLCCLFIPMFLSFQNCASNLDLTICVKSISILIGSVQCIMQIIICHCHHKRLQSLIAEMESHCKRATGHERKILQQYVDKCATVNIAAVILYYGAVLCVITQPSFKAVSVQVKYPFNVTYYPIGVIIYAQQSLAGLQMSSALSTSVFVALLLWFASAKFDMLCTEIRTTSNVYDLIRCIQEHKEVLQYANDIIQTARFVILSIVGSSATALVCAGLALVSGLSLAVKMQFYEMAFICLFEVFVCCWPANSLLVTSSDVGNAAYESLWYSQNVYFQKIVLYIMLRCQKPVAITIAGIMPVVSLNYFCSYGLSVYSYFTAIQVILAKDTKV